LETNERQILRCAQDDTIGEFGPAVGDGRYRIQTEALSPVA
jgi:hypothetical protein